MHTVLKFKLDKAHNRIIVPMCAIPLAVGFQGSTPIPHIWYRCDRDKSDSYRLIQIVGTGHAEISEHATYIGSTINEALSFYVWHIFDVTDC